MKEEQIKKIIKKSTIETSDDFVDGLMAAIAKDKEAKNTYVLSFSKPVLITCIVLVVCLTFLLFKVLGLDFGVLSALTGSKRTPVFVAVIFILLYSLNTLIKLNKNVVR